LPVNPAESFKTAFILLHCANESGLFSQKRISLNPSKINVYIIYVYTSKRIVYDLSPLEKTIGYSYIPVYCQKLRKQEHEVYGPNAEFFCVQQAVYIVTTEL